MYIAVDAQGRPWGTKRNGTVIAHAKSDAYVREKAPVKRVSSTQKRRRGATRGTFGAALQLNILQNRLKDLENSIAKLEKSLQRKKAKEGTSSFIRCLTIELNTQRQDLGKLRVKLANAGG